MNTPLPRGTSRAIPSSVSTSLMATRSESATFMDRPTDRVQRNSPSVPRAMLTYPSGSGKRTDNMEFAPGFPELLARARAGDSAATDKLLVLIRPWLEQLARNHAQPLGTDGSTSDLVQVTRHRYVIACRSP